MLAPRTYRGNEERKVRFFGGVFFSKPARIRRKRNSSERKNQGEKSRKTPLNVLGETFWISFKKRKL